MGAVQTIPLDVARRIALTAQGFADPRPTGRVDVRHIRRAYDPGPDVLGWRRTVRVLLGPQGEPASGEHLSVAALADAGGRTAGLGRRTRPGSDRTLVGHRRHA